MRLLVATLFASALCARADDAAPSSATLWLPVRYAAASPTILASLPADGDGGASTRYALSAASMTGVYSLDAASTACAFRLTGEEVTRGSPFATYTCSELSTAPSPTQTAWCNWQRLLPSEGVSTLVLEEAMVTETVSLVTLPVPTSPLSGAFPVGSSSRYRVPGVSVLGAWVLWLFVS